MLINKKNDVYHNEKQLNLGYHYHKHYGDSAVDELSIVKIL